MTTPTEQPFCTYCKDKGWVWVWVLSEFGMKMEPAPCSCTPHQPLTRGERLFFQAMVAALAFFALAAVLRGCQ